MAELDVQPKRSNPWWIWLLLGIIALAIILFLVRGCNNNKTTTASTDSTSTMKSGDTSKQSAATGTAKPVAAATTPNFDSVNQNAPKSSFGELTDPAIGVRGTNKYTIYTLGENVLFATDKSSLQPTATKALQQIAASLKKRFTGATVGVYGNTDSTGSTGHNKQLGAERANAVKNWLVTTAGYPEDKVSIHSLGASKPVASNATAEGRKENRNVEIVAFPDSTGSK